MADGSMISTQGRISQIVSGMLAKRSGAAISAPSQDLLDSGLTSLDMVNLMLTVEAEFDIEIPQEEMTPDNFRTVAAIHALVVALGPQR